MNPWLRELPFLRLNDESSTCSAKVALSPAPCWPILGDVSCCRSGVFRKKLGEKVGEKVTLQRKINMHMSRSIRPSCPSRHLSTSSTALASDSRTLPWDIVQRT